MNQNTWVVIIAIGALVLFYVIKMLNKANPELVRTKMKQKAKLIDVRSPGEFAGGSVPGAINIPVDQLGSNIAKAGSKNEPVVVFCASGMRSANAKRILESAGFTDVTNGGGVMDMMRAVG